MDFSVPTASRNSKILTRTPFKTSLKNALSKVPKLGRPCLRCAAVKSCLALRAAMAILDSARRKMKR